MRSEFAKEGSGYGSAGDEGSGFAVGLDFAFDQQFAVFDFDAGGVEELG